MHWEEFTGLLIALVVGAAIGWLAGLARRGEARQGRRRYVLLGIAGALLGGLMLGPLIGGGNLLESSFDPMTVVVTALGASLSPVAAILFRRRRRPPPSV